MSKRNKHCLIAAWMILAILVTCQDEISVAAAGTAPPNGAGWPYVVTSGVMTLYTYNKIGVIHEQQRISDSDLKWALTELKEPPPIVKRNNRYVRIEMISDNLFSCRIRYTPTQRGRFIAAMLPYLRSSYEGTVDNAAFILGGLGDPRGLSTLESLQANQDPNISREATLQISFIRSLRLKGTGTK